VILCDAGPLVAIFNVGDPNYERCAQTLPKVRPPLITTWPCFVEAMYLLGKRIGHHAQESLWKMRESGRLTVHTQGDLEADRMRLLMHQYRDIPMDIADASLVAAAETLGLASIFTIESHFYAYRLNSGRSFTILP
jgi:predicted nucleic acid-binding protein